MRVRVPPPALSLARRTLKLASPRADIRRVSRHAAQNGSPRRWMGVGQSQEPSSREAGETAARAALLHGDAKAVIVFASCAYDLEELLAGIRAHSGEVPLIGCSTAGEIATNGPGSTSVVVVAIGGEGLAVRTAVAEQCSGRLRDAGAQVASELASDTGLPHRVLLLLTDGLAGDQQEIVRGCYGVLGASVPLVGGCAGDDLAMSKTFQLHDGRVLSDSVVAAWIASEAPFGIGVRHGWRRVGEPMVVTRSAENHVFQLDDEPALDVYLERLQAPPKAYSDPAAFTRFAMTHPLGIGRRTREDHVRFVAGANFEDRSLGCIAEVPQGGLAWFMEGDADSVLEAADAACADALAPLAPNPPIGVIAFDCIARRGVLGEHGIVDEIERIGVRADGAPVAGFYTYGEIARTQGITGFHNQTLVTIALS
jgi:hypothetical protein